MGEAGMAAGGPGASVAVGGSASPLFGCVPRIVLRELVATLGNPAPQPARAHIMRSSGAVLLVDVSGFTSELNAVCDSKGSRGAVQIGAEGFSDRLSRVLSRVIDTIYRYGGDVVNFIGDACLVTFTSVPNPALEDDRRRPVERAVACAMELVATSVEPTDATSMAPLSLGAGMRGLDLHATLATGDFGVVVLESNGATEPSGKPTVPFAEVLVDGPAMKSLAALARAGSPAGSVTVDLTTRTLLQPSKSLEFESIGDGDRAFVVKGIVPREGWGLRVGGDDIAIPDGAPRGELLERLQQHLLEAWVRLPGDLLTRREIRQYTAEVRPVTLTFLWLGPAELWGLDTTAGAERLLRVCEEVYSICNQFDGRVQKVVHDEKGIIVMQAWGDPHHSHEDDATRAVRALLSQARAIQAMEGLLCNAGVATGPVYIGPVGSNARSTYDIIGNAANLASRLMAAKNGLMCDDATVRGLSSVDTSSVTLALPGLGLVTAHRLIPTEKSLLQRGASGWSSSSALASPPRRMAGASSSSATSTIYSALWPSKVSGVTSSPSDAGFPQLPGRTTAHDKLCRALESFLVDRQGSTSSDEGMGREPAACLFIEGAAGLGKSHLLSELMNEYLPAIQNIPSTIIRATSCDVYSPYRCVERALWELFIEPANRDIGGNESDIFRSVLDDICSLADAEDTRRKTVQENAEALTRFFVGEIETDGAGPLAGPVLLDLCGLCLDSRKPGNTAVMIVVEDFHWLDLSSVKLLLSLHTTHPGSVCLLINTRPPSEMYKELQDVYSKFLALSETIHISLNPLEVTDVAIMVDTLLSKRPGYNRIYAQAMEYNTAQRLPGHALPMRLYARLADLGGGRPQSVRDLCAAMLPTMLKALVGLEEEDDACFEDKWLSLWLTIRDEPSVDDGGSALQRSLIDRLPLEQQMVLKVASVIGPTFQTKTLLKVFPEELRLLINIPVALRQLVEVSFLTVAQSAKGAAGSCVSYTFTHVTYLSTAYSMLGWTQRARIHMNMAELVEAGDYDGVSASGSASLVAFMWGRALEGVRARYDGDLGREMLGDLSREKLSRVVAVQESAGDAAYREGSFSSASTLYSNALHTINVYGHLLLSDSPLARAGLQPDSSDSEVARARWMVLKEAGALETEFGILVKLTDTYCSVRGFSHEDTKRSFALLEDLSECVVKGESTEGISPEHAGMYIDALVRQHLSHSQGSSYHMAVKTGRKMVETAKAIGGADQRIEAEANLVVSLCLFGKIKESSELLRVLHSEMENRRRTGEPLHNSSFFLTPPALIWGFGSVSALFRNERGFYSDLWSNFEWLMKSQPRPAQDGMFMAVAALALAVVGDYEKSRVTMLRAKDVGHTNRLAMPMRYCKFLESFLLLCFDSCDLAGGALDTDSFDEIMLPCLLGTDSGPVGPGRCCAGWEGAIWREDASVTDACGGMMSVELLSTMLDIVASFPWALYYPLVVRACIDNAEFPMAMALLWQWEAKRTNDPGNTFLLSEQLRLNAEMLMAVRAAPSRVRPPFVEVPKAFTEELRRRGGVLGSEWDETVLGLDRSDDRILSLLEQAATQARDAGSTVFEATVSVTRVHFEMLRAREFKANSEKGAPQACPCGEVRKQAAHHLGDLMSRVGPPEDDHGCTAVGAARKLAGILKVGQPEH